MNRLDGAWQGALAAEHQAVFGYGLVGVRLSGAERQLAVTFSAAHADLRDSQQTAIAAAGLTPVVTEADYPSLYPVGDALAARHVAVRIEDACAAAWRYLYAQATASAGTRAAALRPAAQQELTASAVRATRWRVLVNPAQATTAFPGLPE
ncbi:MAG: ferritin-like domain-containing protein [Jatrophihabitans sp.]